jgi:hypothetical protein
MGAKNSSMVTRVEFLMFTWVSRTMAARMGDPFRLAWAIRPATPAKDFPSPVLDMRTFTTASDITKAC